MPAQPLLGQGLVCCASSTGVGAGLLPWALPRTIRLRYGHLGQGPVGMGGAEGLDTREGMVSNCVVWKVLSGPSRGGGGGGGSSVLLSAPLRSGRLPVRPCPSVGTPMTRQSLLSFRRSRSTCTCLLSVRRQSGPRARAGITLVTETLSGRTCERALHRVVHQAGHYQPCLACPWGLTAAAYVHYANSIRHALCSPSSSAYCVTPDSTCPD